ncbi:MULTISPECIES: hypothetical protein [Bradyrhizobium]|uniref:hypothetical protein n=1 Tax=Bradyrhizobium TaxID=374 RepID=UPI001EDAADB9|nr:hypothetical protein [Bradyrhizobium zhengyangense]MCG2645794.1 hypothetical protein [Bradyrhizobium zhengyangense]
MTNDAAMCDALCGGPNDGSREWLGRMGTRRAIKRNGLTVDPVSSAYCLREWLSESGYVDIHPVRWSTLLLML